MDLMKLVGQYGASLRAHDKRKSCSSIASSMHQLGSLGGKSSEVATSSAGPGTSSGSAASGCTATSSAIVAFGGKPNAVARERERERESERERER